MPRYSIIAVCSARPMDRVPGFMLNFPIRCTLERDAWRAPNLPVAWVAKSGFVFEGKVFRFQTSTRPVASHDFCPLEIANAAWRCLWASEASQPRRHAMSGRLGASHFLASRKSACSTGTSRSARDNPTPIPSMCADASRTTCARFASRRPRRDSTAFAVRLSAWRCMDECVWGAAEEGNAEARDASTTTVRSGVVRRRLLPPLAAAYRHPNAKRTPQAAT